MTILIRHRFTLQIRVAYDDLDQERAQPGVRICERATVRIVLNANAHNCSILCPILSCSTDDVDNRRQQPNQTSRIPDVRVHKLLSCSM